MRALRLVVVVVLVAVAATACGSSSKNATSSSTSTSTTTGSFNGPSGNVLCGLARNGTAAFGGSGITAATPAELNKLYQNLGPALDQARSAAPSGLKSDFDTFITAYKPFLNAITTPGYDVRNLPRSALLRLASPQVKAASTRITQYMRQVCKVTTTPTT